MSRAWSLLFLLAIGCGAGNGPNDAGNAPDRPRTPLLAPDPPALPMIAPCPDGWREIAGPEGVMICDPWPDTGFESDCPDDQAHFAGTDGCAPAGTVCPADGWPADLPTGRPIVFVATGAPAGGDGTARDRPFATITAAISSAPMNAVIAIAAGRYDEVVAVGTGMTLWGACPSGTVLTSSAADSNAAVVGLVGPGSGLYNLGIDAPERSAVSVTGTTTTIDRVVITGARVVGISVSFGALQAHDLVVRDTRPRAEDGLFGNAISIASGASVVLDRGVLEGNRNGAIAVSGPGAHLTATSLVLTGTLGQESDGRFGHGIVAIGGAQAELEASVLEGNHTQAIFADGNNSRVVLRRSIVRGTLPEESDSMFGRGGDAIRSASIVLERTVVMDNAMGGLFTSAGGLELTDVIVSGSLAQASDDRFGMGIHAEEEATVSIARVLLAANRTSGLLASDATIDGTDLTIVDTAEQTSDQRYGRGIHVANGAALDLTRVSIARSLEAGFSAVGAGTTAHLAHFSIAEVREQVAGNVFGVGVSADEGAAVTIDIARIDDVLVFGARARGGASITATELGITSIGENASGGGFGLVADDGTIHVDHFAIAEATECAYLLAPGAEVDLSRGDVTNTNVGACLQVPDYDPDRLHDDVVYRGATAQAETTHSLPDALPLLYE